MRGQSAQRFFSHIVSPPCLSRTFQVAFQPRLKPILEHSFNTSMFSGALPYDTFIQYLHADALYLARYGRLLQRLALRDEFYGKAEGQDLTNIALGIVRSERKMQMQYLSWAPEQPKRGFAQAVVLDYLHHMDRSSDHLLSPAISLASLLPCFWAYRNLGAHFQVQDITRDHPYFSWLNTYISADFLRAEARMWQILDSIAIDCPTADLAKQSFERSLEYETLLFDSVCNTAEQFMPPRS